MKSILYVGATLMIGASIYGFVDYKKTSREKEFTSLYGETKKPVPVVEENVIPAAVKEGPVAEIKQAVTKDDPAVANTVTVNEKKAKTASIKAVVKKAKKKKKLDHRIFSRAPLREDIEEEKILPVPPVEKKKTEEKEQ